MRCAPPGPTRIYVASARHIRSHLFFAHARAATATAVARANCHPFAYEGWMFMHNGFIGSWPHLRREDRGSHPRCTLPVKDGHNKNSEAIFLAILGAGADEDTGRDDKTRCAQAEKDRRGRRRRGRLRFTAALTDGHAIYAFRYAAQDSANTLYYRGNRDGTVIASEPLDTGQDPWTPVPENHVLVARPEELPQVFPFIQPG